MSAWSVWFDNRVWFYDARTLGATPVIRPEEALEAESEEDRQHFRRLGRYTVRGRAMKFLEGLHQERLALALAARWDAADRAYGRLYRTYVRIKYLFREWASVARWYLHDSHAAITAGAILKTCTQTGGTEVSKTPQTDDQPSVTLVGDLAKTPPTGRQTGEGGRAPEERGTSGVLFEAMEPCARCGVKVWGVQYAHKEGPESDEALWSPEDESLICHVCWVDTLTRLGESVKEAATQAAACAKQAETRTLLRTHLDEAHDLLHEAFRAVESACAYVNQRVKEAQEREADEK